jgi:uncharacterized protein YkwD
VTITPAPILTPEPENPLLSATSSPSLATLEQEIFEAINAARQAQGLPLYQADEQLATLALAHAKDMAERDYFSHATPEGQTLDDRFRASGLTAPMYGENIQRNPEPAGRLAASAFHEFMESLPHRDNLLSSQFDHIGVAVVEDPPGWYLIVLTFARQPQSIPPSSTAEPQPDLSVFLPISPLPSPVVSPEPNLIPSANLIALERQMVEAINAERQAHGLLPYQLDQQLRAVAQAHAQDLAQRGYMSHITLEGKTYLDRLQEAGLNPQWYGENIQLSVRMANEAVRDGLARWMDDPLHRDNVLHPRHTHIGLGVAQTPEGWYVFVMDLIKR